MDNKKVSYSDKVMREMFPSHICPICGKTIVRVYFGDYVYKRNGKVFCSWRCMREYEKDPKKYGAPSVSTKNNPLSDSNSGRNRRA